ncbi:MAG: hypothetical protein WD850_01420 [Candidatus Spechtbacterales bacterium]
MFLGLKAFFGLSSSAAILIGGVPYLRDIHNRRVKPHVLSWIGWSFITALGGVAMYASGSTWATAILFGNTALCISVAGYAILRKVGVWSTGPQDAIFFVLGMVGLILWQVLDQPALAIIFAMSADFFFGLPTIIKTYKEPSSETPFVWAMFALSGILSMFALRHLTFEEAAYPVYLMIYDTSMLLLVLRGFWIIKPGKS